MGDACNAIAAYVLGLILSALAVIMLILFKKLPKQLSPIPGEKLLIVNIDSFCISYSLKKRPTVWKQKEYQTLWYLLQMDEIAGIKFYFIEFHLDMGKYV